MILDYEELGWEPLRVNLKVYLYLYLYLKGILELGVAVCTLNPST